MISAFLCLLAVGSGVWLLRNVRRFQRGWREAEVCRAPALPEQNVMIPVAGELRLFLEGPRMRTWGKRLTYELTAAATGRPIPIAPSFSGSGVRSRTHSRVERGRLALPSPGDHVLRVGGLAPGDPAEFAIVFMRPFFRQLLTFILSCVFLGLLLTGSLVGALLTALL